MEQLYKAHYAHIYRYMIVRVKHKETAEDLTQEVFLKAAKGLPKYKDMGDTPILAWLYTIARNTTLDFFKKKRDYNPEEPELFFDSIPDEQIGTGRVISRRELAKATAGAISTLTDDQRELITMRYLDGFDYGEIAKILNKSEESLRALNYRAIKELKNLLKDYEP